VTPFEDEDRSEWPVVTAWVVGLSTDDDVVERSLAALRCEPARRWRIGDLRFPDAKRSNDLRMTTNGWRVVAGPERTFDMDEMLRKVLALVDEEHLSAFTIGGGLEGEVSLHYKIIQDRETGEMPHVPGGSISAEVLGRISALGVPLDLDGYVFDTPYTEPGMNES
jgi:hypothetical protein